MSPRVPGAGPNFSPAEIACRGTGKLLINEPALDKLQALRDRPGKPLIVRSAYRSLEHNRAVGGATRSKHLDGVAFDIAMTNHDPVVFELAAREVWFLGFGFYPRSGFMHIDLGPAREWGDRFQVRKTAFAAETPPAREVLADSRTMKGWRSRSGDAGRGWRRCGAERPGGNPERDPAARPLSRHPGWLFEAAGNWPSCGSTGPSTECSHITISSAASAINVPPDIA